MVSPFCMCFFSFLYKDCSQRLLPPAAALSTHAPDRFKPPGGLVPAIAWFSNGIPAGKSPLLQENHLQMSDASAKVCCSEQERARARERESTCQDSPLSYYPHVKISLTVNPQLCNKQNVFAINLLLTTLTKSRSEHVASRNYVDPKLQKV